MELKDLVLKNVLYYMQTFVITAGEKTFEVPRSMIANIDIAKEYDTMLYPMWYVCVNVPNWFYTEMTKNPNNISVSMNLQYRLGSTNEKLISSTGSLTTEISGNFKAIIPYTTQVGDHSLQKKIEKDDGSYNNNYSYNEYAFVELCLYNSAAYAASFNTLNAVISSSTLTDVVTYCFNKCGINNILISKADNNTTYSEFKILPQSGMLNILRIVENYKFHDSGSTLFFDLTESYLVTNKMGCHAWKNNEYKTTHILSLSEFSEAFGSGDGISIDNKYKCNIIVVNKYAYNSQDIGTSPVVKNTGETELFSVTTKNALISTLTPNKEFIVNVDSPDNRNYNGKYRLMAMSVNMVPNGEFLTPTFTLTLRR